MGTPTNETLNTASLLEIRKMEGVSDLTPKMKCGGQLALALRAEAQGFHDKASEHLNKAVANEGEGE